MPYFKASLLPLLSNCSSGHHVHFFLHQFWQGLGGGGEGTGTTMTTQQRSRKPPKPVRSGKFRKPQAGRLWQHLPLCRGPSSGQDKVAGWVSLWEEPLLAWNIVHCCRSEVTGCQIPPFLNNFCCLLPAMLASCAASSSGSLPKLEVLSPRVECLH